MKILNVAEKPSIARGIASILSRNQMQTARSFNDIPSTTCIYREMDATSTARTLISRWICQDAVAVK